MPNPITKTHADWLSLIEISGPFVSMPILTQVFPQGLEDVPAELARSLRADFEFWQESSGDVAVHSAWVRLVLESLLGYSGDVMQSGQAISAGLKAEFPEHEEVLRPDFVLVEPRAVSSDQLSVGSGERMPKLLIQVFPPTQDLGKAVTGSRWAASVGTRMMELLHATEIRLGLVTNGEQWMLVDAPRGETTGFTTWYASLWFDERTTLNAFQSLLGVRRFFGVAEDETLENLLARSADHQQEITDQLGLQVRHAVEILIQAVDKVEQERGQGTRNKGRGGQIEPALLYEAALTVMMRLVFLLSAEERKLLPIDDDQYSNYYAVSTLREQLQTLANQQGEEVLERRFDAWSRLLAVFRAVHGGIRHQELNLPAYGGSLFDPNRFPFLEGRGGKDEGSRMKDEEGGKRAKRKEVPLAIDNRTVLHLLDALQTLRVDGEMRRLSFRALDVEQIGHVYEGLLDHKAARADEVMLGLGGAKRLEPETALSKLEQVRAGGEAQFLAWLKDETQKSPSALKNALAKDIYKDALFVSHLRSACGNDDALLARILPFAGLIRMDDFGNPSVILPGSVYVTAGTSRRVTGSHYTPRSLTEPIVQHTLEPLVYAGVAEGLPREQWTLRSPSELLDLKICDMAMGSGGFLVQVIRYLAERLIEAWALHGEEVSGVTYQVSGENLKPDTGTLDTFQEDKLNHARRLVAERCIYGVDKNPLAVEIAKLSLWLVTLAKERPFTFLDHALKCGDALVGASEADFLRWARGYKNSAMTLFDAELAKQLETARGKRRELEGFVVRDVQDAERKEALLKEADAAMAHVKRGADLLTGARLLGLKGEELEALQNTMMLNYMAGELDGALDPNKQYDASRALTAAQKERVFHWEFEFPEVFQHGGFSAIVGNPPFLGRRNLRQGLGDDYRETLSAFWTDVSSGADLCVFFFIRSFVDLLSRKGCLGLVASNTIAQGATRESGLDFIVKNGGSIFFANSSLVWPGTANVYVSIVHISKGEFSGVKTLDERTAEEISSFLDVGSTSATPQILSANQSLAFQGLIPLGDGFYVDDDTANKLLKDKKNKDVIFKFYNGKMFYTSPSLESDQWIINFGDRDLDLVKSYKDCFKVLHSQIYQTLSEKQLNDRPLWWKFWRTRPELQKATSNFDRVLATAFTSSTFAFDFLPRNVVYSNALVVFAFQDFARFSVMQSNFHYYWAIKFASTMKTDLRYTPTDCFQNFPFPKNLEGLEEIGEKYHEERRQIMLSRQEGLTSTYNRFHNPEEGSRDIVRLRELHVENDVAVAKAYGWGERMNDGNSA